MRTLVAIGAVFALSACVATSAKLAPSLGIEPRGTTVAIRSSELEPGIELNGPSRRLVGGFDGEYSLRSLIDKKSGLVSHQLYVEDSFRSNGDYDFIGVELHRNESGGVFYASPRGEDFRKLEFIQIDREVGSCAVGPMGLGNGIGASCRLYETFGAVLPDSLLRAHPTGYRIMFSGQRGPLVVSIASDQIRLQLQVVDSVRRASH